jgi:hypothetical protein
MGGETGSVVGREKGCRGRKENAVGIAQHVNSFFFLLDSDRL